MKFPVDISIGIGASGGVVTASQESGGAITSTMNIIDQQTAGARYGFFFRAGATGNIETLDFRMWREGGLSTGTYAVQLRGYTSGGTVGSVIASVNVDPDGLGTSAPGDAVQVTFSSAAVTSGSDYCIIFDETNLTGNGLYKCDGISGAGTGNNIGRLSSADSGSSWAETDTSEYYFVATLE